MKRWLARLSYSFLILAAVLGWEGYKLINTAQETRPIRGLACFLGAGLLAGLGVLGIRHRHRDQI